MSDSKKWGMIGIGKLGTALLTRFELNEMETGIYHPEKDKAENKAASFSFVHALQKEELATLDVLLLMLPAEQIESFIDGCIEEEIPLQQVTLINMATKLPTVRLREKYPKLQWRGVKLAGHAESLKQTGAGLFVTEDLNSLEDSIQERFSAIGKIVEDDETIVEQANKLTTYHAISAARELELKMKEENFSHVYIAQAVEAVMPEVIRSYGRGELGQFAREIVEKMEKK